jgi:hypothetical protein
MHHHLLSRLTSCSFLLVLCLVIFLIGGCATETGRSMSSNVDFALNKQTVFYWDEWVRKGQPQVFVSPDRAPENPPTAVFMPLRLTQQMEHANTIGYNLSRVIWQTFLQNNALPTIEFAEGSTPYRRDLALAYGRHRKADLAIGGTINYYRDGGTVSDSAVSIAIEIYDVRSGNLIWSFGQAAVMQSAKVNDYLLFATKSRVPSDPIMACLTAATSDLARMVQAWAYNVVPKKDGVLIGEPKAF